MNAPRILLAPDSFKTTITAPDIAAYLARWVRAAGGEPRSAAVSRRRGGDNSGAAAPSATKWMPPTCSAATVTPR